MIGFSINLTIAKFINISRGHCSGHTKESTDMRKNSATIVGIEKPQERTDKIHLSTSDLARVSMFRQPKAAEILGVSISTLKRRFYEYKLGR